MNLHDVNQGIHKHRKPKRIGRGPGSGHGKTSGRGHKGQGQLAGWSASPIFEGARMPLVRRVPKRGFNNRFAANFAIVNVGDLEEVYSAGAEVTPDDLVARGLIRGRFDFVKILSDGDLTLKLKISAHKFSKAAQAKIEKAGGQVVVLPGPAPVVKNKQKQ
ncbi:MAG: 50S ribosomal protein L15 [Planctomycetota bacterium]|nr:50S ribosomal protein L15 [Planctomycetota bacterium]